ncbi:glutathione S-transferase family protein [uncultured Tateyamaria sp.]|uniref:glutathione S-transferase family protein n=1 Tax=uncultured Tateyamaria sp. TaxID=455651 RepID=UPI0026236BEE|nr:glutathione S-transferase family protein [uncultured Tateyamaria sp.]
MPECKLASTKMSSYGLAARVVLEEKGVEYERVVIDADTLKSPEHLTDVHPFGKVPALYHGDFHLFETAAIARYVDEAFDGPALQPSDVKGRAQMQKWINITGQYIYPAVIGDLVMQRLAPKIGVFGGVTDEAVVSAAVPVIAHQLNLVEQALADGAHYLAGDFSLADIMVATMVQYISLTPESADLLDRRAVASDWIQRVTTRPSYSAAAYDLGL